MAARNLRPRRHPLLARHVCRGPGLVDKHELGRIEVELSVEPCLTPLQNVSALLFFRMRGLLFKCDFVTVEKTPQNRRREGLLAIGDQAFSYFQKGDVGLATNEAKKIIALGLDATRAVVSACRSRGHLAGGKEARHPANRAGYADRETSGRRIARHAAVHNGSHNPLAKIVGMRHDPTSFNPREFILNLNSYLGIRSCDSIGGDSIWSDTALAGGVAIHSGLEVTSGL